MRRQDVRNDERVPKHLVKYYLSVSVRAFLDKINICIGRLSKEDFPPCCKWDSFNLVKT